MGLFSRQPRDDGPLPPDIAAPMEERGRVRNEGLKSELTVAQGQRFISLSREEQEAYVDALAEAILPIGGWAVLGAADLLVQAVFEPDDHPSYVRLILASLELQRAVRVSYIALSTYEAMFCGSTIPVASGLSQKPCRPERTPRYPRSRLGRNGKSAAILRPPLPIWSS